MTNFLRLKDLLLVAVILILVGLVVQQRRVIANLRDTLQSLSAKGSPPAAAPAPKQEPVALLPVNPPVEETKLPTVPATTDTPPATTASAMPNMVAKFRDMAKDPAFKDMIRAQQKMGLDMSYGALYKKLELTGDDLTDFKALLADRQMALMDAGMAMMNGNNPTTGREQRVKEIAQIKAATDKKIEEFLGADGYAIYKDYEDTQSERMQVGMFKHSLSGVDALSEQQEQDLIAAMYQERKNAPTPIPTPSSMSDPAQFTPEKIGDLSKTMEQLQARYLDRAAAILTPAQLAQFKAAQEQMRAMQTMGLKMAAQMFGQKSTPPPAPVAP